MFIIRIFPYQKRLFLDSTVREVRAFEAFQMNGRIPLHLLENGILTARPYINEI